MPTWQSSGGPIGRFPSPNGARAGGLPARVLPRVRHCCVGKMLILYDYQKTRPFSLSVQMFLYIYAPSRFPTSAPLSIIPCSLSLSICLSSVCFCPFSSSPCHSLLLISSLFWRSLSLSISLSVARLLQEAPLVQPGRGRQPGVQRASRDSNRSNKQHHATIDTQQATIDHALEYNNRHAIDIDINNWHQQSTSTMFTIGIQQ